MKHTPFSHNEASQKQLRQSLRNNATSVEALLWRALKGKQVEGLKFRRQFGVGPFVLDFYCPELRLGIELDGGVHKEAYTSDYDEILRTKNEVQKKYKDAFVVAFHEGKKISVKEAREISEKNK